MTPKEKADQLVERYYWTFGDGYLGEQHIQCALIAVDQILASHYKVLSGVNTSTYEYWNKVKQEIEKL